VREPFSRSGCRRLPEAVPVIEQYATPLLIGAITLNALWMLGAWLITRSSDLRPLWRFLALALATLQIAWITNLMTGGPLSLHPLRAGGFALDLDMGGLLWHLIILPLALLAMGLRLVVSIIRSRPKTASARAERSRKPATG